MSSKEHPIRYSIYKSLSIDRKDGIALVTMRNPKTLNSADFRMHSELGKIWLDIDKDPQVRVAIITGEGQGFSSGGSFEMIDKMNHNPKLRDRAKKEADDIVKNMLNMRKPTVSAVNGVAVGAGLAVALCADFQIATEKTVLKDGHTNMGVAAGDHAVLIWPTRIGPALAKRYLLLSEAMDGKTAYEYGLVNFFVPHKELMAKAFELAQRLRDLPDQAIQPTKKALNMWYQNKMPIFEYCLEAEIAGFGTPDAIEGLAALREKRQPSFPSVKLSP